MFVKQLSVFIENREGRLEEVTEVLKQENINIVSLSSSIEGGNININIASSTFSLI